MGDDNLGALYLTLKYGAPKKSGAGQVHVTVLEGRNLQAKDPYVKVYILEKGEEVKATKQKTAVVKGTPHPSFNETIKYILPFPKEELKDHRLFVSVWDNHALKSSMVGGFSFSLSDLAITKDITSWFSLLPSDAAMRNFNAIDEPVIGSITKKKQQDDDAVSMSSKTSKKPKPKDDDAVSQVSVKAASERSEPQRASVRGRDAGDDSDSASRDARDTKAVRPTASVRRRDPEPEPEPEVPADRTGIGKVPGVVHLEANYERPSGGEKHGGTVVCLVTEIRGLSAASANVRAAISKDGKDGKDKVKTEPARASGASKVIKVDEALTLTLPAGPVTNACRMQLTVFDARNNQVGALSFGAKDIKDGNATGWFQLLNEAEGRIRFEEVPEEDVLGEKPAEEDDDDGPSTALGGRVNKVKTPDQDLHSEDDSGGLGARRSPPRQPPTDTDEGHDDSGPGRFERVVKKPVPQDDEDEPEHDESTTDDPPARAAAAPAPPPPSGGRGARASNPFNGGGPPVPPGGAKRGSQAPVPPAGGRREVSDTSNASSSHASPVPARRTATQGSEPVVPRSESVTSLSSVNSANIKSGRTVAGTLSLDLEYIAPPNRAREGLVTVKVGAAAGVPASQLYVKLHLVKDGETSHATRQVTTVRGRDPAFNQYFTFKLPLRAPMDAESFVRVTLWDKARTQPYECVGAMAFSFEALAEAKKVSGVFRVLPYGQGLTEHELAGEDEASDAEPPEERAAPVPPVPAAAKRTPSLPPAPFDRAPPVPAGPSSSFGAGSTGGGADVESLRAQLRAAQAAQATLTADNEALRAQVSEVWQEKEGLETHVKEYEEHSNELRRMIETLQAAAEQHDRDHASMEQRLADKNDEIGALRTFVDRLSTELMNVDMKALTRASLMGATPSKKAGSSKTPSK